ncbi:RHOBTB3 isoform 4, partial [Pan troglodytes]
IFSQKPEFQDLSVFFLKLQWKNAVLLKSTDGRRICT